MSKYLRYAGIAASAILIVFGIASIVVGATGRHTVRDNLAAEQIVGSPDMTPKAIKTEADAAGLKNVSLPTCSVADKAIDNGTDARCFAQYMRIHALEATGGQVYAEMGQYLDKAGKPTSDKAAAAIDPVTKQPMANGARNIWVNETALSTALNTSYFAENVALFSVVMGVALLLTGIGFLLVTLNLLRPLARKDETPAGKPAGSPVLAS
ncbi:MAG: hypothetical protein QOH43_873 [Solirubrobacteraceae bacterium]|jgi:hypothetical protein|nr:hypothetical protein [Solirubrobacteraceae bacterium]